MPIRRSSILELKAHYFSEPALFPGNLVVAVGKSEAEQLDKMKASSMKRISPEEVVYAMLEAIADSVRSKEDDDTLMAWRRVILSVSYHWLVLDSEDSCFFKAQLQNILHVSPATNT